MSFVSVVLRREDARRRERLVPRELRHGDHQPHGLGEQRPAHEEAAQRNQRVSDAREMRAGTTGASCYSVPNTSEVSHQHIPSEAKHHMRAHPVDSSTPFGTGQVDCRV